MTPLDPVMLTLVDGSEVPLLLTLGGFRRVKNQLGKAAQDALQEDPTDALITILYHALPSDKRAEWTEDAFADKVQAHVNELSVLVQQLMGVSSAREKDLPKNAPAVGPPIQ